MRPVGRFDGEIGAGQGDLDEAPHFFQFFFLDPLERIEVFHLAGDAAIESGGIKERDGANPAFTGDEIFPSFLRADTQRADESNARYNNAASQRFVLP